MSQNAAKTLTCPKCDTEFCVGFGILSKEEFPCPNCDAVLRVANRQETMRKMNTVSMRMLILGVSSIILAFILVTTQDMYLLLGLILFVCLVVLPIIVIGALVLNALEKNMKLEVVRLAQSCGNCGNILAIENSGFCSKCGAGPAPRDQLDSTGNEYAEVREPRQRLSMIREVCECMICGKDLNLHDTVIRCQSCGSTFHRAHLLEYLHVHGACPVCGKPIDEMAATQKPPEAATQLGKGNKWMEMSRHEVPEL